MTKRGKGVRPSLHRDGAGAEIRELTRDQILKLIDERARYLLGISGDEFMRRYRAGELEDAPAEAPISVLADLVAR